MPYQENRLVGIRFLEKGKWVSWANFVAKKKRTHDRHGGAYPLEFQLRDAEGGVLIRQIFTYVYDRKSKETIIATCDWDLPVTLHSESPHSQPCEIALEDDQVQIRESDGYQMRLSENEE